MNKFIEAWKRNDHILEVAIELGWTRQRVEKKVEKLRSKGFRIVGKNNRAKFIPNPKEILELSAIERQSWSHEEHVNRREGRLPRIRLSPICDPISIVGSERVSHQSAEY